MTSPTSTKEQVAGHDVTGLDELVSSVAQHPCSGCSHVPQCRDGVFGTELLRDSDPGVEQDDCGDHRGVGGVTPAIR